MPPADLAIRSYPAAQSAVQEMRDHQSHYCHKLHAFQVRAMHVQDQVMRVRSQSHRHMLRPDQASDVPPQGAESWGSLHRGQPG